MARSARKPIHRRRKAKKPVRKAKRDAASPADVRRALKDTAAQIAPMLDSLTDIAYFKDVSGRYLAANASFSRFLGMPKARIVGRTDNDLFEPQMAEMSRASDWKIIKRKKPMRVEERSPGPRGDLVFDTFKVPVTDVKLGMIGLIGVSRDISQYNLTATRLKDVEERLGKVVAGAPIVLFSVDDSGKFILSEGQGLAALGLRPGEVVGRSAFQMYAHNPGIIQDLHRALSGESFRRETEEGGRIFDVHYAPHREADGRIISMIGVAIDITDHASVAKDREALFNKEKKMRGEAERVSRSKDEFLALLSHELRTPMTAMIGWTWLLRSKDLGTDEYAMALDTIERNMKAQAQIIEDLLDISRFTSGRMRIEFAPVELPNVIRSVVDIVRPAAEARQIRINLDDDLPELMVTGDRQRLQQAAWNLLSNAVKFTPEGGEVTVRLRACGGSAEISVADNGVGISEDYLPHVFDPFSQAEDTMTREHRGLGLGLALIKHIAEMHGGAVRVHSEGEGKGTEFMVSLPILESADRKTSEPVSLPRSAGNGKTDFPDLAGLHVLIVEDEPDARLVLSASLKHCGARVTAVGTAAEAFDAVREQRPDVMVSDLAMPGEDGFSLIRRIRDLSVDEGGDIPAAALTGRAGPEDRTQALMLGFQMYLLKPVEPVELAAAVKSLAKKR